MVIQIVETIVGIGPRVYGTIENGTINIGDTVILNHEGKQKYLVVGDKCLSWNHNYVQTGIIGQSVGITFKGTNMSEFSVGDTLNGYLSNEIN